MLQAIAAALGIPVDTLLTQAGISARGARDDLPARPSTEQVIRSDPDLTTDERETLLRVYRALVQRRERPPA